MKKVLLFVCLAVMIAMPLLALAQIPPQPPLGTPTPPVRGGTALTLDEVENFINRIAQFLIAVSLVIAVIAIIWGGIVYMTAGANDTRSENGRKIIFRGIIGALVVLAIGVILQTLSGLVARTFFS